MLKKIMIKVGVIVAQIVLLSAALSVGLIQSAQAQTAQYLNVTAGLPSTMTYGSASFNMTISSSSGLAVTIASTTPAVCTTTAQIANQSTVNIVSGGTCSITASQTGNATYAPVSNSYTSTVVAEAQYITVTSGLWNPITMGTTPITITATSGSGLPVTLASTTPGVCSTTNQIANQSTVNIIAPGACSITASQGGNIDYAPTSHLLSSTVTLRPQTITFGALTSQNLSSKSLTVAATSSASLAVTFSSATPSQCSVTGTSVSLLGLGTCTVTANQGGNTTYAAATPVSQSFIIEGSNTIQFAPLKNQLFGVAPFAVSALSTAGLPVTLTTATPVVCTVANDVVTLVSGGTCTLSANQSGNADFTAAPQVQQSFTVLQDSQIISFAALPNLTYGGTSTVNLAATSTSGLTVSFTSGTTAVCTVSGTTLTVAGGGTCTINANQPGNSIWAAAPQVGQSFTIGVESQSITFAALVNQNFGVPAFNITATSTSALPVSFTSPTSSVCTTSGTTGNTVTLVAPGTCTIYANQAGTASYAAAPQVVQSFTVNLEPQTITFASLTNQTYGTTSTISLNATSTSALSVTFSSLTPACTVNGTSVTFASGGSCTIAANQIGNTTYAAATQVTQSFTIGVEGQAITFAALPNASLSSGPLTMNATSSGAQVVTYTSTTPSVCTTSGATGGTVNLVALGNCSVTASVSASADYSAATPVIQSFTVTQGSQAITFGAIANQLYSTNPVPLTATTSAPGLAVTYVASPAAVCTIGTNAVNLVAPGNCTVTASQAGTTSYATAVPVVQTFTIAQAPQTITFAAPVETVKTAGSVMLSAISTSGQTVSFASNTGTICTVSGAKVTFVTTGSCSVTASLNSTTNYLAATPVTQTFSIVATADTAPALTLTAPGSFVAPLSGVTLTATATPGGSATITQIQFFNGSTLLGSGTLNSQSGSTVTYNYAWAANIVAGTYSITAKATDSTGAVTTSSAGTLTVTAHTAPVVTLTAPGSYVLPFTGPTLTAAATPAGSATITQIQFFNGSTLLGSGTLNSQSGSTVTYNYAWTANIVAGTYSITAKATDSTGAVTTSSAGTLTVTAHTAPAVTLTAPGTYILPFSGLTLTAAATPGGSTTITQIQFFNGSTLLGSGTLNSQSGSTVTYNYAWTANIVAGTYSITAKATDSTGAVTTSSAGTLTVSAHTAPAVTLQGIASYTAPLSGISFAAGATPSGSATITQIQFFNGSTLLGSGTIYAYNGPATFYSINWNVNIAAGTYSITAKATDSTGAVGTSSVGTLSVGAHIAPQVSLTAPGSYVAPLSNVSLLAAITTSGQATVSQVQFFNGSTLLGSGAQYYQYGSQDFYYSYTWAGNIAVGTYSITAKVTDSTGVVTTSSAGTLTVAAHTAPVVTLTSLGTGQIAPYSTTLTASATSAGASTITQLQFFNGSTLLGAGTLGSQSGSTATYTFNWPNVVAGSYSITAKATDSTGAVTTSAADAITVTQPAIKAQTITFAALPAAVMSVTPITLTATSSSGLAITYSSSTTPTVCSVNSTTSTLTMLNVGTCKVTASQPGNIYYSPATAVSESFAITTGPQAITFNSISNPVVSTTPVAMTATSSGNLTVSYTTSTPGVCSVNGSALTLSSVGTCTVTASDVATSNYTAATPVSQTLTVGIGPQTITFAQPANTAFSAGSLAVSATSSSALAVTLSTATPAVCTVTGSTAAFVTGGQCTLTASQPGTSNYSAATPVSQSFNITAESQIITFAALPNQPLSATVPALAATSTSGQPVSFTSTTPSVCTVSGTNGTTVNLATLGTCTIAANVPVSTGYSAAPPVQQSFNVTIGSQTINFAPLAGQSLGAVPFTLSATTSGGLTVAFASNSPAVCTVSGITLTMLTAGGCSVTATQGGTTSYTAAPPVTREFTIGANNQTITFNPVAAQSYAGTATTVALTATSSAGLPVSFTSGTDSVCTVTGSTVTLLSAGTCTLTAVQAGDSSYDAAAPVVQSFTVTGTAISIAVTSPVMSQTLQSPVTMTLTAAVSDNSGNTITNVAFYNGTSLMGTVTQFPYSIAIPNATAGSYSITAQATDSKGLTATSAVVTVTVAAGSGAEQLYYISTDQLNTPRLVTNSAGTTVWQWDGEAFGNTPPNSNPNNLGTFTFNMRFPGQYFDAETNLHYNYFRDYNPATGGYIESDPIGLAGGQASTYSYVGGNPMSSGDPFGLWAKEAHDYIFEHALASCGASDADIAAMEAESDRFDRKTGLGISGANLHSMRKPFQSVASALQGRDFFVDQQITLSQILYGDGSSDANSYFARAAHTMQDSTSPEHVSDGGIPYVWPTPWNAPNHGNSPLGGETLDDLLDPRNASRLADAIEKTRDLYRQMTGKTCSCQK